MTTTPHRNKSSRERSAARARAKPLEPHQRDLLDQLKRKGSLTIGHTTAVFSPRDKLSQCTPSQAHALVCRGLAETERPNPRGPRMLKPLPAAFKIALSLALCLLVCACGPERGNVPPDTLKTTSEGNSDGFKYQVIEVEAGNAKHSVLVVRSVRGVAVTKLCTTFSYDGKPYFVDTDGDIYEWTKLPPPRQD